MSGNPTAFFRDMLGNIVKLSHSMSQKLDIQNIEALWGGGYHVPSLKYFKYGHFAFWGERKVAVSFFVYLDRSGIDFHLIAWILD